MPVKAAGQVTIAYNSNALAGHLNDASVEAIVKELDTTVLTDTGQTKIPGISNWDVNIGGPWSSTLDGYLAPDAISPPATLRTLVVVYGGVTLTWTTNAFISNYKWNASNPTELLTWTGKLSVSGVPVRS